MAPDRASHPAQWFNARARELGWKTSCDETLAFDRPELNSMHTLWSEIAQTQRLPSRALFTARLLKPFLPHLSILSVDGEAGAARRYRHRYVGTTIARVFGEMTGLCFEDILPPELRPATLACFDTLVDGRRPLRFTTRFQLSRIDYLGGEIFAAPLSDDGVTPNMLLSITYFIPPSAAAAQPACRALP
jgi:hypothetical protein